MSSSEGSSTNLLSSTNSHTAICRDKDHLVSEDTNNRKYTGLESMPMEILEIIYVFFLGPSPDPPDADSRRGPGRVSSYAGTHVTPITLCHISSYQRRAALGISALWSSIYIYNIGVNQLNMVHFWLNNASTRPLSISIVIYRHTVLMLRYSTLRTLTDMLLRVSNQWKSFSLRAAAFAAGSVFSGLRAAQLASLEYVFLHLESWNPDHQDKLFYALAGAPILHHIEWSRTTFGSFLPAHTPWSRFKRLTLEGPLSLKTIRLVLERAQALQTLHLGQLDEYQELESPHPVSVSSRSLTITSPVVISQLLSSLTFPNLSELHIDVMQYMHHEEWKILRHLVADHDESPPIVKFTYSGLLGDPPPTPAWSRILSMLELPRMAQLVQLFLHLNLHEDVITILTHWPNANNGTGMFLLPCLETLSLSRCAVRTEGIVAAMVLSRFTRQSPSRGLLKHVDVTVENRGSFVQDENAFRELRRVGISAYLCVW